MTEADSASAEEQKGSLGGDPAEATGGGASAEQTPELTLEQILAREDVQRALQSLKDKEATRIEREYTRKLRETAAQRRYSKEQEELDALVESEDFETLGQRTATDIRTKRQLEQTARAVTAKVEEVLLERPEFRGLGEDTLERVYNEVDRAGGNVIDLMSRLSQEYATRQVSAAVEKAKTEFQTELEALRSELGLKKREETGGLSEEAARTAGSVAARTEDQILEAFGEGEDIPLAEVAKILKKRGIDTPI